MGLARNLKVGTFVFLGLLCAGVVTFLLGQEHGIFSRKQSYVIDFKDVLGLQSGAPVRMGGVNIGTVSRVGYSQNPEDRMLHVKVEIYQAEADRIRADTVAQIANKGLLGDKMVNLTAGSPSEPVIPPGGTIRSEAADDLGAVMEKLGPIMETATSVLSNLEKTTDTLASPAFRADLEGFMKSASETLHSIDRGQGYLSRLIHDPAEADKLSATVAHLDEASGHLATLLAELDATAKRVNQGPGLVHSVLYTSKGEAALGQVGDAAEQVAKTLEDLRRGNGLGHALIYGDDGQQQLIGNLDAASGDLKAIFAGLREGKGTLGALLVDPSVYEDVKLLLGNVSRNDALRALVRFSIKEDERDGPQSRATPERLPASGDRSAEK